MIRVVQPVLYRTGISQMMWFVAIGLVVLTVVNLFKFISFTTSVVSILPMYFPFVRQDPSVLEKGETRDRLENAWIVAFYMIWIHGFNVLVLSVLAWRIWQGRLLNPPPLVRDALWSVGFAMSILNLIVVWDQIQHYLFYRDRQIQIAQLLSLPKHELALTIGDTATIWAWIGVYALCSVAGASLAYYMS